MSDQKLSGMLVKPDKSLEFFWEGQSYGSVLPEEMIDAVLEASEIDKKKMEEEKWKN
jgi:hypothetical protein